jgi:hypothetical protein
MMSASASAERGEIMHRVSRGWLQRWISLGLKKSAYTPYTHLERPSVKLLSGTIIFPLSSIILVILQVARIETMAIQRLLSARYCPVQILVDPDIMLEDSSDEGA